ncbi:MAG: homoserine O-acetyltransferase [Candidatus Methylacidiphilales bacterium]
MSFDSLNLQAGLFTLIPAGESLELKEGSLNGPVQIAYETYGTLSADRSNAILLFHALSGSHHAAGITREIPHDQDLWTEELHLGWWDEYIGPGKVLDTERYFIICANYLGGCYGSTGPRRVDPATGRPYGSLFPRLRTEDQCRVQATLLDHLGIDQLHAVIGPSVGGMLAQSFATLYPQRVKRVVSIASSWKTTVLNRLLLFEQILAIENDPHFHGGDYYHTSGPTYGLALARMISHKTFVHLDAIERRADREVKQAADHFAWYVIRDNVQSYMIHQGKKFVHRFDANTYLRICELWSLYDPLKEAGVETAEELFAPCREAGQHWLVFSIDSDYCFFPEEQDCLAAQLRKGKVKNMHLTVHSDKGHDSFLLEPELFTPHLDHLLNRS